MMLVATLVVARGIAWYTYGEWLPRITMQMIGAVGVACVVTVQNAAFAVFAWWRAQSLAALGVIPQWGHLVLWSIIGAPLVLIVNMAVGLVFALFGLHQNQAAGYPLVAGDYTGQLVFWVAAALIAPLGEEVLFRGYLWGALHRHYGTWWALCGTAVVFAIGHSMSASQGAIVLVSQTLVMGLVLAWVRQSSGSIWAGFFAHSINNSIAVAIVTYCVNHPGSGCALSA